jgi:hypothetical protein
VAPPHQTKQELGGIDRLICWLCFGVCAYLISQLVLFDTRSQTKARLTGCQATEQRHRRRDQTQQGSSEWFPLDEACAHQRGLCLCMHVVQGELRRFTLAC